MLFSAGGRLRAGRGLRHQMCLFHGRQAQNPVSFPVAAVVCRRGAFVRAAVSVPSEEKYEIKSGDTLDKIAYRFYGKYDVEKIDAIQKINNITDPSALQIGQVIIIPVDSQR